MFIILIRSQEKPLPGYGGGWSKWEHPHAYDSYADAQQSLAEFLASRDGRTYKRGDFFISHQS